jgi:sugar phosphate permease
VLLGVWSANFLIAFQSMSIPTMTPAVGSWFGHAELGSYLGSAFSLGNAAGECGRGRCCAVACLVP